MITERQIKSLTKSIDKFNADLAAYFKASEDESLPYIDCTVIGYSTAKPYAAKVYKHIIRVTDTDGEEYTIKNEYDLDEVKQAIAYDRRRLNKAWRVWRSENPDVELEKDDED